MSQPNYGPCSCHECQGIHCLIYHPGHSCRLDLREKVEDNWKDYKRRNPAELDDQEIEDTIFNSEVDWNKDE